MSLIVKKIGSEETIEFLEFNYDGSGNAIVDFGDGALVSLGKKDVCDILFGANGKDRTYLRCREK